MPSWTKELFNVDKPIIAMCHLRAMPGDPGFDQARGMDWVVEEARKDLLALQRGGVDAVMFSNEFSLPYLTEVKPETVAAMGRVVGELLPQVEVPFGVNVLWDPYRSLDLAAATGALFIREIMSGVYASDFGLWNTNSGQVARHRAALGLGHVRLMFNIVPEAATYLGSRELGSIARTTVFNALPDALCVSGLTAGAESDPAMLKEVKDAVGETVVFANTGCRVDTIERQLTVADGAVVGTAFKVDGVFENAVDESRVSEFMKVVRSARAK